jgi:NAD(P)-dependent dehydrogenase (short-subunit alcohol dehydrogenase family)
MTKGTCIVTGGASGIGLATATVLLDDGWHVAIADANTGALDAARKAFPERSATFHALDVTNEAEVEAAVQSIVDASEAPLAGLVNCAGIAKDVPFLDTDAALFRRILDVNVVGGFIVAKAATRAMLAAGTAGAIVNIASISGLRGNLGRTAYGASKGAVITMTKVMAVELAARSIRVNAIAPGPVDTPLVQAIHNDGIRERFLRTVPQKRYADPREIAHAIAFLLDNRKASNITGQILAVDGGFDAGGLLP